MTTTRTIPQSRTGALAVLLFVTLLVSLLSVSPALAGDGVIEINMAAAAAGGITPSDTPGFPVTLDSAGSYMLTGNLETGNANVNVIEITASYVTLDLNGFAILGPSVDGSGNGVSAAATREHIEVRNGMVVGMGSGGVRLAGASSRAENIRARGNRDDGIQLGIAGVAKRCTATHNGDVGVVVSTAGSLIENTATNNGFNTGFGGGFFVGNQGYASGNVARNNTGEGLVTGRGATIVNNAFSENSQDGVRSGDGSLLQNNTSRDNTLRGMNMGSDSGYIGNVLTDNGTGSVSGGIQIGTNLCNTNTVCP
ncbi:MAG: hypothetical protein AAGC60_27880 [Acidobacteriota bacterium]